MRLLYPSNPLRKRIPDDQYREEADAAEAAGFALSVFSLEDFQDGSFRAVPEFEPGIEILYRGWMLNAADYASLAAAVVDLGAKLKVSTEQYLAHHHLPSWYPIIADLTPETKVLGINPGLEDAIPLGLGYATHRSEQGSDGAFTRWTH